MLNKKRIVEIQSIEFSKALRGYDPQEVNDLIHSLIPEMEEIVLKNEDLTNRLRTVESNETILKKKEENIGSAIIAAQEAVDIIKETARREAEKIIEEAKADAEALMKSAAEEARKINLEAQKTAAEQTMRANDLLRSRKKEIENLQEQKERILKETSSIILAIAHQSEEMIDSVKRWQNDFRSSVASSTETMTLIEASDRHMLT